MWEWEWRRVGAQGCGGEGECGERAAGRGTGSVGEGLAAARPPSGFTGIRYPSHVSLGIASPWVPKELTAFVSVLVKGHYFFLLFLLCVEEVVSSSVLEVWGLTNCAVSKGKYVLLLLVL